MATAIHADDVAYLTALVRTHDRPRYYATLFTPAAIRDDLFALYGFAAEIAQIPNVVSEPTLGEIRLRWWSDALASAVSAEGAGDAPALRAAAGLIGKHRLPLAPFEALIAARSADLYSDPPATIGDLEGRLGETQSALFQMAAIIAGANGPEVANAAGHAGVAYGIAYGLANLARDRARGRIVLPADLMQDAGISAADLLASPPKPEFQSAVSALTAAARDHLGKARSHLASLRPPVRNVFMPLAVVPPILRRVERTGAGIAGQVVSLADIETLLRVALRRL